MKRDASRNQQGFRRVSGAEADTGSNAFRQIMDSNSTDKQQHLIQIGIAMVTFRIRSYQMVHMRYKAVDHIQ